MTIQQLQKPQQYANEILEIIEIQLRNDEESMTQSDLQAVIDSIVRKIIRETIEQYLIMDR